MTAPVLTLRERLRETCAAPAAGVERALFTELNPGRTFSPLIDTPPERYRRAAVLLPILRRAEADTVLFTVRAPTMPSHAGEISFPGGTHSPGDRDDVDTALREAEEEVGLPRDRVEVLGQFGVHLGGLGYAVTPVVGLVEDPGDLVHCDREVDEIFEVPLAHFTELGNHTVIERTFRERDYRMFAVPYGQDRDHRLIWGLTAGILHTFAMAWHDRRVGA